MPARVEGVLPVLDPLRPRGPGHRGEVAGDHHVGAHHPLDDGAEALVAAHAAHRAS
ncbi:MAG: hypothetical protein U0Q15_19545 [Kineosporiaceae bacterium]